MADSKIGQVKTAVETLQSLEKSLGHAQEYLSVEAQINDLYKERQTDLQKLIGYYKSVQMGAMEAFKKEYKLKEDIKSLDKEMGDLGKKALAESSEQKRAEMKVSLEGMLQRRVAWEKEASQLEKLNKSGLGVFLYFVSQAVQLFKSLDKAAAEFRKTVGLTRDQTKQLKDLVQRTSIDFMHVGVNADIVNKTIIESGKSMGGMNNVSKKVVETVAILNAQLGVAVEDSVRMLRNFAVLSGTLIETQTSMVYFSQALSAAAGVSFNQIAADFRNMKDTTFTMVSRLPLAIAKTAVELRRMGTDLNTSATASSRLLDFTQNIQDEMEASVLLGHSINLQRARQLAYSRDIEGSTKEILKIAKQSNFAHGMDRFQMEAFARATGRSVEDLLSMVQASEEIDAALNSSNPKIRAAAENYEKMRQMNSDNAKQLGESVEHQLRLKSNQERLTAISQKWSQIIAQVSEYFLPIIDYTLQFVNFLMPALPLIMGVSGALFKVGEVLKTMITPIGWFAKVAGFIGTWIGPLMKFITPFIKFLGPIGWVITAFQAISGFIKGWKEGEGFWDKLGKGLVGALRGIIPRFDWLVEKAKMLWEYIKPVAMFIWKWTNPIELVSQAIKGLTTLFQKIAPALIDGFKSAWEWIKGIFIGSSPSNLGLGIVKGILGVGTMLFDALTAPWRHAFAWILDKIPGMDKFAERLRGGIGGASNSVETKVMNSYVPAVQVTPSGKTIVAGQPTAANAAERELVRPTEEWMTEKTGQKLVDAILGLRSDLNAGKISINMDGQLLSTTLARQTEFRGGYGVNKI